MATQLNPEKKEVILSQIIEDLNMGLTKWKKDDIGFGSLEKKYNLLPQEAIDLFSHPKVRNVETKIPSFIIVDDIPDEEVPEALSVQTEPAKEDQSRVEIVTAVVKSTVVKSNTRMEAFI